MRTTLLLFSGLLAASLSAQTFQIPQGGTGANTAAGADGNLGVPGPIYNPVKYGAVGDCTGSGATTSCTDNHNAIQAAIDAAYAVGGSVYFPTNPAATAQTVYYTAAAINPKGVSMFGPPGSSGASGYYPNQVPVAVRGAPGNDVFDVVDASLPGYVAPHPSFALHDLGIIVDDSVDASASFPTRRPGRVTMDAAMSSGSAILSSATAEFLPGDAGQAVTVTGAGASGATLSTTISSWQSPTQVTLAASASTTVTAATLYVSVMGLPTTQNIGNCAFAYDDYTATYTGVGPSRPVFDDMMIQTTSNNALNHTCGFFFQGNEAPYQGTWENSFVGATFPFAFVPATGTAPTRGTWTGIGDFNLFDHVWMAGHYPFIAYDGGYNEFRSVQISSAIVGPHILSAYGVETYPIRWSGTIPEYEPDAGACTSGLVGFRISGLDHNFQNLGLAFCAAGETFQWDAAGSTVNFYMRNGTPFNITGDNNTFTVPWNADWVTAGTINDSGRGNKLITGSTSNPIAGVPPDRSQMGGGSSSTFAPASLRRDANAFNRTHDFLNGSAGTFYFNDEDGLIEPKEIFLVSGAPTIVSDANSENGYAFLIPHATSIYPEGANGTAWYLGSQIPPKKVRIYVSAYTLSSPASVVLSWSAYYSAAWHTTACVPFSVTSTVQVFSCDADMSGLSGDQFRFEIDGDASVDAYAEWIGIRPYDSDPYGNYAAALGHSIVALWTGASGTLVDDNEGGSGYESGAVSWGSTITGTYYVDCFTTGWTGGSTLGRKIVATTVGIPIDGTTFTYGVDIPTISAGRGNTIPSVTCMAIQ